ncbi:hypothetical protein [Nannocystis pusilla]|uniref:hypothetical protein n=1 Tax=Nannocystis pusilla TaxID=889268 RepID=UPI003B7BD559
MKCLDDLLADRLADSLVHQVAELLELALGELAAEAAELLPESALQCGLDRLVEQFHLIVVHLLLSHVSSLSHVLVVLRSLDALLGHRVRHAEGVSPAPRSLRMPWRCRVVIGRLPDGQSIVRSHAFGP